LSIEATYRKTAALIATISSADCEKLSTHLSLLSQREFKISSFSNFVQIPNSSLTMDMSIQIPMVGYFIYRSGEQADPTALEFCPPKGSDELFCNNIHFLDHVSIANKS
jgi:hypothetical protein